MDTIMDFIQNFGFPIAITVYLLYERSNADKLHKEEMDSMRKEMTDNNMKMTEAVNNNTIVLTRILEVLHVSGSEE